VGEQWYTPVSINRAKVKSAEEVREILDGYDSRLLLKVVDDGTGKGTLVLDPEVGPMDAAWPSALRLEDIPDEDDFESEHELMQAEWQAHEEQGHAGLIELLSRLSPFLESPLIVVAADFSTFGNFGRAMNWMVRPGEMEVEVTQIRPPVGDSAQQPHTDDGPGDQPTRRDDVKSVIQIHYEPSETGPAELLDGRLARVIDAPLSATTFWKDDVVRLSHLPGEREGVPEIEAVVLRRFGDQTILVFREPEEATLLSQVLATVGADSCMVLSPRDGKPGIISVAFNPPLEPAGLAKALGINQDLDSPAESSAPADTQPPSPAAQLESAGPVAEEPQGASPE
jgi:hypothetical protein